jgi:hypothetical protein
MLEQIGKMWEKYFKTNKNSPRGIAYYDGMDLLREASEVTDENFIKENERLRADKIELITQKNKLVSENRKLVESEKNLMDRLSADIDPKLEASEETITNLKAQLRKANNLADSLRVIAIDVLRMDSES